MSEVRILTFSSSATATEDCAGHVVVSGSYGGEYNAWHAAKWGIRGLILNDAGVGRDNAGIVGLYYLDRIGLPAATADAQSCHIADGEHMLAHGVISHVNAAAAASGCKVGQSVRQCAEQMKSAPVITAALPAIAGGKRFLIHDDPIGRKVICLDAAPMLEASDAGSIAITGSHAALFRGKPDDVIGPDIFAIFFSDAGVGLDQAGIQRLALLDERGIIAGAVRADSAPIGDSRAILRDGILSHFNRTAGALGARADMPLRDFVMYLRALETALDNQTGTKS